MRKLFSLAVIGMIAFSTLQSCSNTGTGDLQHETVSQTEMKVSAKESNEKVLSFQEAIDKTSLDSDLVAVNSKTLQIIYHGKQLPQTPEDYYEDVISQAQLFPDYSDNYTEGARSKRKTLCSTKAYNGMIVSIVHVYSDHYSGYQFVTTNPSTGSSYASEMGPFAPVQCLSLWMLQYDFP